MRRPPFPSDNAYDPDYSDASEPSFSDDIDAYNTEYVLLNAPQKSALSVSKTNHHLRNTDLFQDGL